MSQGARRFLYLNDPSRDQLRSMVECIRGTVPRLGSAFPPAPDWSLWARLADVAIDLASPKPVRMTGTWMEIAPDMPLEREALVGHAKKLRSNFQDKPVLEWFLARYCDFTP